MNAEKILATISVAFLAIIVFTLVIFLCLVFLVNAMMWVLVDSPFITVDHGLRMIAGFGIFIIFCTIAHPFCNWALRESY